MQKSIQAGVCTSLPDWFQLYSKELNPCDPQTGLIPRRDNSVKSVHRITQTAAAESEARKARGGGGCSRVCAVEAGGDTPANWEARRQHGGHCSVVQYCDVMCTAVDRIVKYSTVQCKGAGVPCSAAWRVIERPPGKNFQLCSKSPGAVV